MLDLPFTSGVSGDLRQEARHQARLAIGWSDGGASPEGQEESGMITLSRSILSAILLRGWTAQVIENKGRVQHVQRVQSRWNKEKCEDSCVLCSNLLSKRRTRWTCWTGLVFSVLYDGRIAAGRLDMLDRDLTQTSIRRRHLRVLPSQRATDSPMLGSFSYA